MKRSPFFVSLLCSVFKYIINNLTDKIMKNTLKISALVLAFAGLASGALAQTSSATTTKTTDPNGVILSVGVDAGIPTGNLNNGYNWNIGGSVQADIPVLPQQLLLTINAGYNSIQGKNNAYGTGL